MAIPIISGADTTVLTIDTTSKAARTTLYDNSGNSLINTNAANLANTPSGLSIGGFSDNTFRVARFDRLGNIRTGQDQLLLHDDIEGTTINTQLWTAATTTFTQAQVASTGINLNSGNTFAASSSSMITSKKMFSKMQLSPIRCRIRARIVPQSNAIGEWGFGAPTAGTAQVPYGAYWRFTASGSIVPVISYNGADAVQGTDISTAISALGYTNYYSWSVIMDDDNCRFTCQNTATGQMVAEQVLQIPATQAKMMSNTHVPVFVRLYENATGGTTAPYIYVSDVAVLGYDAVYNKPWYLQQAQTTNHAMISPTAFTQTAQFGNSANPAAATLSNTAAGYTTLGGLFNWVPTTALTTDYNLFCFTVPTNYQFVCTGIYIDTGVWTVLTTTAPMIIQWFIATNGSSVNLSSNGAIRVGVGSQTFATAAAAGTMSTPLGKQFTVPVISESGTFFTVGFRFAGVAPTAAGSIGGMVNIEGFFE